MHTTMTRKIYRTLLASLFVLLLCIHFPTGSYGLEASIDLAPNIINLNGSMETFVIHTNIAYRIVAAETVTLNGETIYGWKMDSLGLFDAIILLSDIEDSLIVGELNDFLLEGKIDYDNDGVVDEEFWGVDKILVIDKASKPGKL